jgi:hypothetical protein
VVSALILATYSWSALAWAATLSLSCSEALFKAYSLASCSEANAIEAARQRLEAETQAKQAALEKL